MSLGGVVSYLVDKERVERLIIGLQTCCKYLNTQLTVGVHSVDFWLELFIVGENVLYNEENFQEIVGI